jgi:hypothetical protein
MRGGASSDRRVDAAVLCGNMVEAAAASATAALPGSCGAAERSRAAAAGQCERDGEELDGDVDGTRAGVVRCTVEPELASRRELEAAHRPLPRGCL